MVSREWRMVALRKRQSVAGRGSSVLAVLLAVCAVGVSGRARAFESEFDRAAYEEPGGLWFRVGWGGADGVLDLTFGEGVWLAGTPVFGGLEASLSWRGEEETLYGGLGMTFRLLPHWGAAPFVGAGGAYWYGLTEPEPEPREAGTGSGSSLPIETVIRERDSAYWDGFAECGLRVHPAGRPYFVELVARYVFPSSRGDSPYWMTGFVFGNGARDADWN